jgi:hypothetical protein
MMRFFRISSLLLALSAMGCSKARTAGQPSEGTGNALQSEDQMTGVIFAYTEDGWRDQESTRETVGDVLGVKILTPMKCNGFKITIIDDSQVFRKAKLNREGTNIQLILHAGLPPIADDDELFVSAFREVKARIP